MTASASNRVCLRVYIVVFCDGRVVVVVVVDLINVGFTEVVPMTAVSRLFLILYDFFFFLISAD